MNVLIYPVRSEGLSDFIPIGTVSDTDSVVVVVKGLVTIIGDKTGEFNPWKVTGSVGVGVGGVGVGMGVGYEVKPAVSDMYCDIAESMYEDGLLLYVSIGGTGTGTGTGAGAGGWTGTVTTTGVDAAIGTAVTVTTAGAGVVNVCDCTVINEG